MDRPVRLVGVRAELETLGPPGSPELGETP